MKEKLKELGFKINHRWSDEHVEFVHNNLGIFNYPDKVTLRYVKKKMVENVSNEEETVNNEEENVNNVEENVNNEKQTTDYQSVNNDTKSNTSILSENNKSEMFARLKQQSDNYTNETPVEKPKKTRKKNVKSEDLITGYLLLIILDFIFPSLFVFIHNRSKRRKKISADDLRLTPKEIKDLQPIADEVAKTLVGEMSPVMMLAITYGATTFGKYMCIKN